MGWDALSDWGNTATRLAPLTGGVANDVWSVRINGQKAVARLGKRSNADMQWEADLLKHLSHNGLTVPVPLPTLDGRLFSKGIMVMPFLEGDPPKTDTDWKRVADTLRHLHEITRNWPQRPGWRSSIDYLHETTGTKVNLTKMPAEGVERCRAAWARLKGRATCVVHGDPNPGNVRITHNTVALIDWDEAHVDVPVLDLVRTHASGLEGNDFEIASQASAAWEAAVCWDDDYARRRLAEVKPIQT